MDQLKKVLRDRNLSLAAKAMFCFIETLDGSVDPYRLYLYIKESPEFQEKILKELVKAGYVKKVQRDKMPCYLTMSKM